MVVLIHIVLGITAIVVGFAAMRARKFNPSHARLGEFYHWLMLAVCLTALIVSYSRGRANVFTYLAPPSYAAALLGYLTAKYRPSNWLRWHISAQSASYIALITATLFQIVPRIWHTDTKIFGMSLVFWVTLILPGVIGNFFIRRVQKKWAKARVDRRRDLVQIA
jgi:hypothetical protein